MVLEAAAKPPETLGVDESQFENTLRLSYDLGLMLELVRKPSEAQAEFNDALKHADLTSGDKASYGRDNILVLFALDHLGRTMEADGLAA